MKIIILGAGQVGRTAAYHLSREEANDVTVIDMNEEILRDLQDRLDIRTVNGNAASPKILEAAGIADTDILVALTSSDEVNMLACHIAWTLYRTPKKIARVRSADFTERERIFGENAVAVALPASGAHRLVVDLRDVRRPERDAVREPIPSARSTSRSAAPRPR